MPIDGRQGWTETRRLIQGLSTFNHLFHYRRRIEPKPDYTQWQEPIGTGNDYPLPVGTVIEYSRIGKDTATITSESSNGKSNAILDMSGVRVEGFACCKWRVKSYPHPSKPALPFKIGDWVQSSDSEELYEVKSIFYPDLFYLQASDTYVVVRKASALKKVEFRPFASAEEFEPYRDDWFSRKDDGAKRRFTFITDTGVDCHSWKWLFDNYTFENGRPFGIAEEVVGTI